MCGVFFFSAALSKTVQNGVYVGLRRAEIKLHLLLGYCNKKARIYREAVVSVKTVLEVKEESTRVIKYWEKTSPFLLPFFSD